MSEEARLMYEEFLQVDTTHKGQPIEYYIEWLVENVITMRYMADTYKGLARVENDNGAMLQEQVEELLKRIAELEAAHRWIPVTERLPEKDGTYAVIMGFPETVRFSDGKWDCYGEVTHWMPLPDAP